MATAKQRPDPAKLRDVIRSRNLKKFTPYLNSGIDLNAPLPSKRGDDKMTPLGFAIESRAEEIAVALIKAGVKIKRSDVNLVWAVCTKDPEIVQLFIKKGGDLNAEAIMGTPLDVAAKWGLPEIVRLLIDAGADVNARSLISHPLLSAVADNQTAAAVMLIEAGATFEPDDHLLLQAVHKRNGEIARALVKAGADVNDQSDLSVWNDDAAEWTTAFSHATPLIVAAGTGQDELVRFLLSAGADPHVADANGTTAHDWALRKRHKQIAEVLAKAAAMRPRRVAPETDLLFSSEKGDLAKVKKLLAAGADPNARDERPRTKGYTPLMLAAAAGHANVAAKLLDAGADLRLKDDNDRDKQSGFEVICGEAGPTMIREAGYQLHRTALACAAENGRVEVVKLLIQRGADVNALDRMKWSPLMLAAASGSVETVRELIQAGANIHAHDRNKQTAFMNAASEGHSVVVAELLKAGAKLESKDDDGYTALHWAASGAHADTVSVLLRAGADVHAATRLGSTALHLPLGDEHLIQDIQDDEIVTRFKTPVKRIVRTVRVLLEAGADPRAKSKYGDTPLMLAEYMENQAGSFKETVDLLKNAPRRSLKKSPPKRQADKPVLKAKRETRPKVPELPRPKFSAVAKSSDYKAAVNELEKLCGTKRQPMDGVRGGYTFHIHSSKRVDRKKIHLDYLKRGFYVFATDTDDNRLAIFPTANREDVIATMQTNGANFDLGPADIAAWLRDLEKETPFILTGIGFDFLSGEFTRKPAKTAQLAERMHDFCPDLVDQGVGDVKALAAQLRESKNLFFWWD